MNALLKWFTFAMARNIQRESNMQPQYVHSETITTKLNQPRMPRTAPLVWLKILMGRVLLVFEMSQFFEKQNFGTFSWKLLDYPCGVVSPKFLIGSTELFWNYTTKVSISASILKKNFNFRISFSEGVWNALRPEWWMISKNVTHRVRPAILNKRSLPSWWDFANFLGQLYRPS